MNARQQQQARVNVGDATWQEFRIRPLQAGRTVADELARLVRNDLRHPAPSRADPSTCDRPTDDRPEVNNASLAATPPASR